MWRENEKRRVYPANGAVRDDLQPYPSESALGPDWVTQLADSGITG